MPERWINRLTVFASKRELKKFLRSKWKNTLQGRFWELQENMRTRIGWQFETQSSPVRSLECISRRWTRVTLVLVWERTIGLAKAKAGRLQQFEVRH